VIAPSVVGTVANVGETVAVSEPAVKVTEVGVTVLPSVSAPVHSTETVNELPVEPDRVSVKTAGVVTRGAP
jgi:hypothetical protein